MVLSSSIQTTISLPIQHTFTPGGGVPMWFHPLSHANTQLRPISPRAAGSEVIIRAGSICSLTPAVYLDYRNIDRPSLTGPHGLSSLARERSPAGTRRTETTRGYTIHSSVNTGAAWQRRSRRVGLEATTDSAFQACKKQHRSESAGKIMTIRIMAKAK